MIEKKTDGTTQSILYDKNSRIYRTMHYGNIQECVTQIISFLATPKGGNKHDAIVLPKYSDMFYCINVTALPDPEITFDKVLTSEL